MATTVIINAQAMRDKLPTVSNDPRYNVLYSHAEDDAGTTKDAREILSWMHCLLWFVDDTQFTDEEWIRLYEEHVPGWLALLVTAKYVLSDVLRDWQGIIDAEKRRLRVAV